MSRDEVFVEDIIIAGRKITLFTAGADFVGFSASLEKQSAVLYQIAVIGEAVARLSPEFKLKHSSIPWIKVRAMRNVLVHDYRGVDIERVWQVVAEDLPLLIQYLKPLAPEDDSEAAQA